MELPPEERGFSRVVNLILLRSKKKTRVPKTRVAQLMIYILPLLRPALAVMHQAFQYSKLAAPMYTLPTLTVQRLTFAA